MSSPRAFIPRPRRHGVISQQVDGETLLYVEETHQASALNPSASHIWTLCDGKRAALNIAAEANLSVDVVQAALRQLADAGLFENGSEMPPRVNHSRRRMLVGVGIAAPAILIVLAPWAKAAASTCQAPGTACTVGTQCCSHDCVPVGGGANICG